MNTLARTASLLAFAGLTLCAAASSYAQYATARNSRDYVPTDLNPVYVWQPEDGKDRGTISCDQGSNQNVPFEGSHDQKLLSRICRDALDSAAFCTKEDCQQTQEVSHLQKMLLSSPKLVSIKVRKGEGRWLYESYVSYGAVEGTELSLYTTWHFGKKTSTKWFAVPR